MVSWGIRTFMPLFGCNSRHRALVTKAARGRGSKTNVTDELLTPAEQYRSMTWAQRLKRVFNIGHSRTSLCFAAFVNPFTSRPVVNVVVL